MKIMINLNCLDLCKKQAALSCSGQPVVYIQSSDWIIVWVDCKSA